MTVKAAKKSDMSTKRFGSLLKARRKEIGLTQLELAEKLGYGNPMVSAWEQGRSLPTSETLPALALVLNVNGNTLLNWLAGDDLIVEGYRKRFREMATAKEAEDFVDDMLEDFGTVTELPSLLKDYATLTLLYTMTLKDRHDTKFIYDVNCFTLILKDNVRHGLMPERYNKLAYLALTQETRNDAEKQGGILAGRVARVLRDIEGTALLNRFKQTLILFADHVNRKCGFGD